MRFSPFVLAFGAACTFAAHADDAPVTLAPIVVTPSGAPQPLSAPLQHTTVIDRADIDASAAPDVPSLLRAEAGVDIGQSGGVGAQTSLFLRGTHSNQVLVLIDGVRVSSSTTGATALNTLLPDQIERIEIVRGNVSSLYGSEAIGGVVQIFTRKDSTGARVAAGSNDRREASANVSRRFGDTTLRLGASDFREAGFSRARSQYVPTPFVFGPGDNDRDATRNQTVNAGLTQRLAEGHELGLTVFSSRLDTQFDGASRDHSVETLSTFSAWSENRLTDGWTSRVQAALGRDRLLSDRSGTPGDRFYTDNRQLDWVNLIDAAGGTLRLGASGLWQKLDTNQAYSRTDRRVASAYAGYTARFGAHDVQANLRHDQYSDFGGASTGLLGYGWRFASGWRASGSVSTAFRAPTFNELYGPYGGNPALAPERARNAELALAYEGGIGRVRLTAFAWRTRDLVDYVYSPLPAPFGSYLPYNVNRAANEGTELTWNGRVFGLDAGVALTAQNPRDADTGAGLLRRSRLSGSATLGQRVGAFEWHAEVLSSQARPDVDVASFVRTTVPGYAVINLALGWRVAPEWKLGLKLANLADRDYSLVHGYNTQGRGAWLSLAWEPK